MTKSDIINQTIENIGSYALKPFSKTKDDPTIESPRNHQTLLLDLQNHSKHWTICFVWQFNVSLMRCGNLMLLH